MQDIPGFIGKYKIDKYGNVFSVINSRFKKTYKINSGYLAVQLNHNDKFLVHRLVALTYIGRSSKTVNHRDGDKLNNHISNLEYMTYSENENHAYEIGLKKKSINDNDVLELYRLGFSHKEISTKLKCSRSYISLIVRKYISESEIKKRRLENQSRSSRGRKMSIAQRTIRSDGNILVFKNGKLIGEYISMGHISETLGVSKSNIRNHLSGKYKQFNGYTAKRTK